MIDISALMLWLAALLASWADQPADEPPPPPPAAIAPADVEPAPPAPPAAAPAGPADVPPTPPHDQAIVCPDGTRHLVTGDDIEATVRLCDGHWAPAPAIG